MTADSSSRLRQLCWPREQLHIALPALARQTGMEVNSNIHPAEPPQENSGMDRWLQQSAQNLGLEAQAVTSNYSELDQFLGRAAPALIRLRLAGEDCFLALCGSGRRQMQVFNPQLNVSRVDRREVLATLMEDIERPHRERIDDLLETAGIAEKRRRGAATALLRESLGQHSIGGCWLLRQPAGQSIWRQLFHRGLHKKLIGLVASHTGQYLLFLLSWWIIGRAVLNGSADPGWFAAWVLLMLTQIPLALLTTRLQGTISVQAGTLIKKRLLASALQLAPDRVRHMGAGQMLSRVYDAENIESSALQGGFLILLAAVELGLAIPVLALGSGGAFHIATLLAFLLLAFLLGRRQFRLRSRWAGQRLSLTHSLIEKMVGHRTRLAQQPSAKWHRGEDRELSQYLDKSIAADDSMTNLVALLPRSWLLLGIVGLAPAFIGGVPQSAAVAVGVGGILFGYRAVLKGIHGFTNALNAIIAWRNIRELFVLEAQRSDKPRTADVPSDLAPVQKGQPLLYMRKLRFTYPNKEKPILREASLSVVTGDRLLLQGASGSGKSTLANLITGTQAADDGLLLLHGYDRPSLGGHNWRRLVASAPQFHENHVLCESFLFNLLMGDCWPPNKESVKRAYAICRELGLGPLLEKMPAGILQTVGEMGWQLSHGEKSRLYIARALLQNAELVVLDESFAALDPQTLQLAVDCVKKHASTLLVIAHP